MRTIKLTIALLKNFEMIDFEKRKSKVFYFIMALLTFIIIFIPIALLIGFISYGMTKTLLDNNMQNEGINFILYSISIFSFIFSINVIMNIFYTSSDISNLLSLPFKNTEIIMAKFISALINESFIQSILVISASIGYLIGIKAPFYSYLLIPLYIISFSIVPLVISAIISIIFMYFVRNIKNRNIINKISSFLVIISVIVLLTLVILLFNNDIESFTINLGNNAFMKIMNIIFLNVNLLTKSYTNILYLFLYLLINLGFIIIMLILTKMLYFKGLNLTNYAINKSKGLKYKSRNPSLSFFIRELKQLFKTPAYFANCVVINFIWPLFIVLLIYLYNKTGNLNLILERYHNNDLTIHLYFIIGVIVISILITAANSISSSVFSREGKAIFYLKALPIDYKRQILLKNLAGIIISFTGLFIYIIIFEIFFDLGVINMLLYIIVSLLSVLFVSNLGCYLDTINPKLIWDDEMNSLRGNHSVFINMAISIMISGVLIGLIFILNIIKLNFIMSILISILILIIFLIASLYLLVKKGVINYSKIE